MGRRNRIKYRTKKTPFYKRLGTGVLKNGATAAITAYKALKTANYVRSLVNVEHKHYDDSISQTTTGFSGNVWNLFQPIHGTAYNQRIGDRVKVEAISLRGWCLNPTTSTSPSQLCRLIVFQAFGERGLVPSPQDILNTIGTGACVISPYNRQPSMGGYKILMDRVLRLQGGTTEFLHWKFFKKLGTHTTFSSGSDTLVENGGLYFMAISAYDGSVLNTVSAESRVRFIDN